MEIKCAECGVTFQSNWKHRKFCNNICYFKYRKGLKLRKKGSTLICLICGNPFYVMQHRVKDARYCSNSCYYEALRRKIGTPVTITASCKYCGENFSYEALRLGNKRTYCSKKCQRRMQFETSRKTSICVQCGNEFEYSKYTKRKYCSEACRTKARDTRTKSAPTSRNGVRRAFVRRGLITHCEDCGYKEHLEILGIHHTDEEHSNNSFDNLIVLCPNCHSIRHNRHIIH